ncbi:MAG: DNA repair protein RecN [Deltaproteobacteria bacterium]|nr:DNA repair protein RecN [Deltaproteobacteria bacterium]
MLCALRIQNFAIIDELEVRFGPGFNALTGETGAGKSILVDALHLVLGGRARAEVIRTGADEATVEALFEGMDLGDRLAGLGLPTGGGELLIRRVIHRSGRGRAWINGAIATVGLLEQTCRGLVDISGQHEHVSLLDPQLHLSLLDGWADLHGTVARYREAFDRFAAAVRERAGLAMDDVERARRADYLSFQIAEIERLDPQVGEDESLSQERKRLASATKLRAAAEESERALYSGESAAADLLGVALGRLQDAAAIDPALEPVLSSLKTARIELEESARALAGYVRGVAADPARLAEVDERLEALKRLCRKHGGDLSVALARRDEMKTELSRVERHAERLSELDGQIAALGEEGLRMAQELSLRRRQAAGEFARAVESELAHLAMGKTAFAVQVQPASPPEGQAEGEGAGAWRVGGHVLTPKGIDTCELLLSPNPGEEAKPLSRIASGGELSRVMLAIKRALAKTDPVPTYVFDEVDAGIGGAVAEVVGRMLKDVSRERQVLCITHLPQIAACADAHYTVAKRIKEGRTTSRVEALGTTARTKEIARMLAGVEITPAAMKNAEEMLEASSRRRRR